MFGKEDQKYFEKKKNTVDSWKYKRSMNTIDIFN